MSLTATQEGISFGPFDAVGEKCGKKAPRRCPAGTRPSRLQWLYAPLPLLVKQMVACTGSSPFPCPISCCPTHTGHVGRQHLHPDSFCCVSHLLCDCIMHVEPSHKAQMLSLSENRDSFSTNLLIIRNEFSRDTVITLADLPVLLCSGQTSFFGQVLHLRGGGFVMQKNMCKLYS